MIEVTFRAVAEDLPGTVSCSSSSSGPGPPTAPGTCATARRRGRPSSNAGGCCASICPSWCRPGSAWSSWSAAAISRRASCRSTTRRAFVAGCTQALWTHRTPALVRNYDYAPHQFDGLILRSALQRHGRGRDERLRLGGAGRRQRARARRVPGLWRPPSQSATASRSRWCCATSSSSAARSPRPWRSSSACRSMSATTGAARSRTAGMPRCSWRPTARPGSSPGWSRPTARPQDARPDEPSVQDSALREAVVQARLSDPGAGWGSWSSLPGRAGLARPGTPRLGHALHGLLPARRGRHAPALARQRVAAGSSRVFEPGQRTVRVSTAASGVRASAHCTVTLIARRCHASARNIAIGADPSDAARANRLFGARSTRRRGATATGSVSMMANAATRQRAAEATTEQRWPGFFSAALAEVGPRGRGRGRGRARPRAARDRADRQREHRQPGRARGAGLGAHQQVRRGLSRQALLRRLRVCRRRRAARDRARQAAVRLRLRQRAAALRRPGQRCGHAGAAASRATPSSACRLDAGGHLTHGAKPAISGKCFKAVQYGVREEDGLIDYDAGRAAGATSTSRS